MKILFFTQNLARTGSEVALYNLIDNANRQEIEMAVAAGAEGELLKKLPADVPYSIYGNAEPTSLLRRAGRRAQRLITGNTEEWLAEYARDFEGYIWYINTIVQPYVLRQARKFGVECVVHSHELEQMLWSLSEDEVCDLIEYPRLVLANSQSSRDVLRRLGREEALEVCYEPVELRQVIADQNKTMTIRAQLGIPAETFVWTTAGSIDPNKNPLLFIELAQELSRRGHQVHFLWLGGGAGKGYKQFVEATVQSLNLGGTISFVGAKGDDYYDYLNVADGFVVTSLRESFSIVTVEAAHLGKVVVAFNCGGVKEIIGDGMGVVIDSWNRADLIAAMESAMRGELDFDPAAARARVLRFDAPVLVRRWEKIMHNHFSHSRIVGAKHA